MTERKAPAGPYPALRDAFLAEYLPNARACSPETVKSYRCALLAFEAFCAGRGWDAAAPAAMAAFSYAGVTSFVACLRAKGAAPATVAARLAAVKSFLSYCAAHDEAYAAQRDSVAAVPAPKVPDRGVQSMSLEATRALLAQPDASKPKGLRDQAFMTLMYDAGARMSEVLALRLRDIVLEDGVACLWLTGKGGRRRKVPIDDEAVALLLRYAEAFHQGAPPFGSDLLFYTVIHGERCPMSDDCARAFIKKYARAASEACPEAPASAHPHMLRHSRAMHLYQAGNSIFAVRDFLGHKSIATTDVYARADARMLKEAVAKVAPCGAGGEADWERPDVAERLREFLARQKARHVA